MIRLERDNTMDAAFGVPAQQRGRRASTEAGRRNSGAEGISAAENPAFRALRTSEQVSRDLLRPAAEMSQLTAWSNQMQRSRHAGADNVMSDSFIGITESRNRA